MFKKLLLSLTFALGCLSLPTGAAAAECTLYEQSHPAFTLDGAHLSGGKCSTCASCHRSGVFIGTPKNCVACHNGDPTRVTLGRSAAHIPTALVECGNCHNTTSFTASWNMTHSAVASQRCDTCHGGGFVSYNAQAKKPSHVATVADCGSCHSTIDWSISHAQIHAGITTGCVSCHDNNFAIGKASYAPGHPVTSDQCETCHSIDAAFKCAQVFEEFVKFASLMVNKAIAAVSTVFA